VVSAILPPRTLLHRRYQITKLLGQGDFGTVYQARDLKARSTPRHVALKEMPMQMIVDCERQADIRAQLIHPNIPRLYDYFVTKDHSYLVQQLVRGSNLEEVLDRTRGFLSQKKVLHWAIQICDTLDYLHTHPLHPTIFRDIKPNNIMVDRREHIYLVDFGLARVFPPNYLQERQKQFAHYRVGVPIGAEGYSPREQYRGHLYPQSDLYALGASLHHLLTKRDPRKEKPFTFQQFPVRSLNPLVSPQFEAVIMKATQRRIAQRFSTAQEMLATLKSL
jgi:serine/threonine protein kinase